MAFGLGARSRRYAEWTTSFAEVIGACPKGPCCHGLIAVSLGGASVKKVEDDLGVAEKALGERIDNLAKTVTDHMTGMTHMDHVFGEGESLRCKGDHVQVRDCVTKRIQGRQQSTAYNTVIVEG